MMKIFIYTDNVIWFLFFLHWNPNIWLLLHFPKKYILCNWNIYMAKLLHVHICPIKLFLKLINGFESLPNLPCFELLDSDVLFVCSMFNIIHFFTKIVYPIKIQISNFVNLCLRLQCSETWFEIKFRIASIFFSNWSTFGFCSWPKTHWYWTSILINTGLLSDEYPHPRIFLPQ